MENEMVSLGISNDTEYKTEFNCSVAVEIESMPLVILAIYSF